MRQVTVVSVVISDSVVTCSDLVAGEKMELQCLARGTGMEGVITALKQLSACTRRAKLLV